MRHTLHSAYYQPNTPQAEAWQRYYCPKTGNDARKIGTFSAFSGNILGTIRYFQQLVYKGIRGFGEWGVFGDKRQELRVMSYGFAASLCIYGYPKLASRREG